MKFYLLNFALSLLLCNDTYAVARNDFFILDGTVKTSDTGRMILIPVNSNEYYPYFHHTIESSLTNGHFYFKDSIDYPCQYQLGCKRGDGWIYISARFFIEKGRQSIQCDLHNSWETPLIVNKTMTEFLNDYMPFFSDVKKESALYSVYSDSIKQTYKNIVPDSLSTLMSKHTDNLKAKADSTLILYAGSHPDSYVVLWEIIDGLARNDRPIYSVVYHSFSTSFKLSHTVRVLKTHLDAAKLTCVGCTFQNVKLLNAKDLHKKMGILTMKSTYTLIDFWFSHCDPCLKSFQLLKKIYSNYGRCDLEIVGISIDGQNKWGDWIKVIKKENLIWPQFADPGGIYAGKLSINSFPSNFLLDKNGIIIRTNISPEELQTFLSSPK